MVGKTWKYMKVIYDQAIGNIVPDIGLLFVPLSDSTNEAGNAPVSFDLSLCPTYHVSSTEWTADRISPA